MGLTNTGNRGAGGFPGHAISGEGHVEVSNEDVRLLTQFLRLMAVPPRKALGPLVSSGRDIFHRLRCNSCHRETVHTGPSAVKALDHRVIHPYTDLLLHDMGPALSDGIREGAASEQEFRTPPLWGMGSTGPPYLHDGRAHSIDAAILAHAGEGQESKNRYLTLGAGEQRALLEFLSSL